MNQKHNYDFSQPNKLDQKALWLVLGNAVWVMFRSLWPILAVLALRGFDNKAPWLYLVFVGIFVLIISRSFINYFYYSYQISGDELIIRKGWLSKSKTVVKFDKIHEVNLNQKLLHKIIGLYMIKVDTAGSSETEISINGVDYRKALALKEVLSTAPESILSDFSSPDNEEENDVTSIEDTTSEEKIKISLMSLIKIGLTRNYLQTLGLLLAVSFQIIEQVKDILFSDEDEYTFFNNLFSSASYEQFIGLIGVFLVIGLILFVIIFNLIRTLFTYFNYQINIKDKNLTVSYGLTDSHIIAVPSKKVQLFRFQQNYFQKIMNLFEVKIQQVASTENNKQKKGLIVPGANQGELAQIFNVIYQSELTLPDDYIKPHKRILLLRFFWLCIPAALAFGLLFYLNSLRFAWLILPFFALFYFFIYRAYRNEKLYIKDDFIVLKKGVWDISTTYLQINKVQQIGLSQSYFQEGRQLGSLSLYTAGGAVVLYYYDFKKLQALANEWLYKIEKDKYRWM